MWYGRINQTVRHLREVLPYITVLKTYNLVLALIEKHLILTKLKSYPVALKVDPTPFCQLHCPLCFHSDPKFNKQFKLEENLSKENLKKIIEPLKKRLFWVSLSHRGEPFLNPNLIECIEYLHENNIAVSFPTNFSVKIKDEHIIKLVKSGLDAIFISLDGTSSETYLQYRVGGNFDLVLQNVKKMEYYKQKFNSSRPRIVWKFIIFEHNKHEISIVKNKYKELGFDSFELVYNKEGEVELARKEKRLNKRIKIKRNCYWLWHIMVILSDGQVNPCCWGKNFNIGNAFKTNILEIWNNTIYKKLRSGFKKENYPDGLHYHCKRCYKIIP